MIETTYRHLVTTSIAPTLRKLNGMSVFDGRTAYRLHKIHEKIKDVYIKSMTEFDALGSQYAKRDEKGQYLKDEKGQHIPLEGREEEYKKAIEGFLATPIKIEQHKISIDRLTARFSGEEIDALLPILEMEELLD